MKRVLMKHLVWLAILAGVASPACAGSGKEIVTATGRSCGVLVLVGSGGTDMAIELVKNGRFVSRILCASDRDVSATRARIHRAGLYGEQLAAIEWDGSHLPFGDRIVDLLVVAENTPALKPDEIARVLGSQSVAYLQQAKGMIRALSSDRRFKVKRVAGALVAFRQPLEGMDDWTHMRHGADNNPRSVDRLAGPPYTTQWISGPPKARSHAGSQALVCNGRIFYTDYRQVTPKDHKDVWKNLSRITAQEIHAFDADNGFPLWETAIKTAPKYRGSFGKPLFVASGDWVFNIGTEQGCQVIDAATGRIVRTIGSRRWLWVSSADGKLLGIVAGSVRAYDPKTGKKIWASPLNIWTSPLSDKLGAKSPAPIVLGRRILMQFKGGALAFDLDSGKELWVQKHAELNRSFRAAAGWKDLYVLSWYDNMRKRGYAIALKAEDGSIVWARDEILDGTGFILGDPIISATIYVKSPSIQFTDHATGKEIGRIPNRPRIRCVAITGLRNWVCTSGGLTMVHARTKEQYFYPDFRSSCSAGAVHGNGCTYMLPNDCLCSHTTAGLIALSSRKRQSPGRLATDFIRGPGKVGARGSSDWPTYKYDMERSSTTPKSIQAPKKTCWQQEVGGKLTAPIVADGMVICANDQHLVQAYDAQSGRRIWRFIAGGAITQAPTYALGAVFFGALDGWVYALEAKTGRLAWRRKAMTADYILVNGHLSSRVPVKTNVLVDRGLAWICAGGLSLDRVVLMGLDAKTGAVKVINDKLGLEPSEITQSGDTGKRQGTPRGLSPEGAIVATRAHLIIPNGLGRPIAFARGQEPGNGKSTRGAFAQGSRMAIAGDILFMGLPTVGGSIRSAWGRGGGYLAANMRNSFTYLPKSETTGVEVARHVYSGFHHKDIHRVAFAHGGPIVTQGQNAIGAIWRGQGTQIVSVEVKGSEARTLRYDTQWSTDVPMVIRSALRAGDTYFAIGEGQGRDGKLNGKALLSILGTKDGNIMNTIPLLDGHPRTDSIAAGQGKLFFVTEEGLLIAMDS